MSMAKMTVAEFLETLASESPTPGGGAVAALSAATGAALIAMVGRLTVGKKGFEDVEDRMRRPIADRARRGRGTSSSRSPTATPHAFDGVMAAFKMPKETDRGEGGTVRGDPGRLRGSRGGAAGGRAQAVHLMRLAEDATAMGNPHAASDGLSAAASLYCGDALRDRERRDQRERVRGRVAAGRDARRARWSEGPRRPCSMKEALTAFQLRLPGRRRGRRLADHEDRRDRLRLRGRGAAGSVLGRRPSAGGRALRRGRAGAARRQGHHTTPRTIPA